MDPFFEDVPLGLRIIDPVQIHTNGDINCSCRGKLYNLFVVLKECHRYFVKEVKCVQHSNLLMCLGTTSHKDYEIWEGYYCNLVEFLQKIESHRPQSSFAVDFLSQILTGLAGLHKRNSAHGNLVPEIVVIQTDSPVDSQNTNFVVILEDANTSFIVKLKDYDLSRAGEKDFLKDLKFFGRILELFVDQSREASDLLCRIQGTWENVKYGFS
ncbi:uncharacterized protein LOC113280909 [Papaver somniferum]|uniref:uncharacterized protein LOC113280909 n=1 Tax=Papaver somniferum TaxID=3469 RepID=UPI000E6FA033|nr:uncharacterized protein LOC113280909 [Papaver somniferum]XP_026385299.1 uncharacterized protein LOC113280909 [Papaver somniferum]